MKRIIIIASSFASFLPKRKMEKVLRLCWPYPLALMESAVITASSSAQLTRIESILAPERILCFMLPLFQSRPMLRWESAIILTCTISFGIIERVIETISATEGRNLPKI